MADTRKPYVYVTLEGPDDGGDFGPNTPGTRTSGIQEALDHAVANSRDVHIWGGHIGDNVYRLQETLRVPWAQDWRLDCGNCLLSYEGSSGDAIVIDSQMNCRIKLGLVGAGAGATAVRIKPTTPGPDGFSVVTASVFDFSALVAEGTGLVIDSSEGIIVNSRFFAEEFNTHRCGVHITDGGGSGHYFSNNEVQVMFGNQMHSRGDCVGLQLGDPGSTKILHNDFKMSFHAPRGAHVDEETRQLVTLDDFTPENAIGASLHAQRNSLNLSFFGPRQPGADLVFEEGARDNTVFAYNLPNGITNRSAVPTNRIVPNWPAGSDVATPVVPASDCELVNDTCFTIQSLILTPGDVSSWTLTTAGHTSHGMPHNLSLVDNLSRPPVGPKPDTSATSHAVPAGLFAGQSILLEPGDSIRMVYSEAPTWAWRALR